MSKSSNILLFIECILTLLKFFLTFFLFLHFGLIKGFILTYLIFFLYKQLMKQIFGLTHLSSDKQLIGLKDSDKYNIILTLLLENLNFAKFKQIIKEKGFLIPKLRSIIVYKFYNYYWKEIPLTDSKRLEKLYEKVFREIELEKEEDLNEYIQKEINIHLENIFTESEELAVFPYEILLVKFKNSEKGAVLFKTDHVISDGLGFVSCVCTLADNYSPNVFPTIMKGRKYTILDHLLDLLQFPYYLIYMSLLVGLNKPEKTPFKRLYDEKGNKKYEGKTLFAVSEKFALKKVENLRKLLKVSFNDIAVNLVLYTINQQLAKIPLFSSAKNLNFILPVGGFNKIPENIQEVELCNQCGTIFLSLPLISDFEAGVKKISKTLNSNLKCRALARTACTIMQIIIEYLPTQILCMISDESLKKVDMIFSNVPGPSSELIYAGSKVLEIIPVLSTGRVKLFLPVYSYNKNFRFIVCYDESVGLDPKELIRGLEDNLNEIVKKYE